VSAAFRYLRLLLRLDGAVLVCAFPTMLLPPDWMAATHEWLGLGEFPRRPVVDYLARSVAVLYGFHGVLLFIIATDCGKYRALITYVAVMNVVFGAMLIAVDLFAGLPTLWTLAEGPPLIVMGLAIGWLNARTAEREPGGEGTA
jgi:hypothetical protein